MADEAEVHEAEAEDKAEGAESDTVRVFARTYSAAVRDEIAPENQGDAVRHGGVRAAFLSVLNRDARVLILFREWAGRDAPPPHAGPASAGAGGAGRPRRAAPRGAGRRELTERLPARPGQAQAVDQALTAVQAANAALLRAAGAITADRPLVEKLLWETVAFVRALGTPWPWLACELQTDFIWWVSGGASYTGAGTASTSTAGSGRPSRPSRGARCRRRTSRSCSGTRCGSSASGSARSRSSGGPRRVPPVGEAPPTDRGRTCARA